MYTKIELFAFADFYHRWARTGLTMEEMLVNFQRYSSRPRDIYEPIKPPGRLKAEVQKAKPDADILRNVLAKASELNGVEVEEVNGKGRQTELVAVRQWVAFVGIRLGFEPPDFHSILNWDRSGVYHKYRKASEWATVESKYRENLKNLLEAFGCDAIID